MQKDVEFVVLVGQRRILGELMEGFGYAKRICNADVQFVTVSVEIYWLPCSLLMSFRSWGLHYLCVLAFPTLTNMQERQLTETTCALLYV
jgi:hypothetical protein